MHVKFKNNIWQQKLDCSIKHHHSTLEARLIGKTGHRNSQSPLIRPSDFLLPNEDSSFMNFYRTSKPI